MVYPVSCPRNLEIIRPNQVWSADITDVPLPRDSCTCAILDWYSRYVLSWRLSNSLEESFCLECLRRPGPGSTGDFQHGPGMQFTAKRGRVGCLKRGY